MLFDSSIKGSAACKPEVFLLDSLRWEFSTYGMPDDSSQPMGYQAPYPLAMIICEGIWHDPNSGKRTLLGCLSVLNVRKFPATRPVIAVYAAVTDGRGQIPITLRLVDADEEDEP